MMTDCPPTPQQHIQYSIQLRSVCQLMCLLVQCRAG
jgi:hypothetical protein